MNEPRISYRYSRVMLIKPIYFRSHYGHRHLPAGLGYISEALNRVGILNTVVDMGLGYDLEELKSKIQKFEPDLIGVSIMSLGYKDTYGMINELKKAYPEIAVIAGGPHVSTLRERVMRDCLSIDYGVTLEGEQTIIDLCSDHIPVTEIKGLLYRDSSREIKYTGNREFISDLDTNGFPTYSQFELHKYPPAITVTTSRGCPYACIYCSAHIAIGKRFRFRSAESVADEFEYWHKRGLQEFWIADDNFTLRQERAWQICDEIEKRHLSGLKIACGNGIRADKVTRELLARMKEVGFYQLAFGVEAGTDEILKRLRKSETINTIEYAVKNACDLGYQVKLFFLLGSPGETKDDIRNSINLATKYPVYDVCFNNLIPYPNTELFDWVTERGYLKEGWEVYLNDASHKDNEPFFRTPELSFKERKRLYEWSNRIVKWHTLKVKWKFHKNDICAKFQGLGLPSWVSARLTNLYFTRIFQQLFVETKLMNKIKELLVS